jgi:hypothetical protein
VRAFFLRVEVRGNISTTYTLDSARADEGTRENK